ncbi:MAG: ribosome recycling factor [bacterium]
MTYDFSSFKQKTKETEEWLIKELTGIRTGRATVSFLDGVKVDSYGSMMHLSGVASVNTEDPKTIRITPWDRSQTQAIEKAITLADLGVSVSVDDKGLRVIFPELTGERRQQLAKIAKQKLEESKVALRRERGTVSDDLNKKKKDGEMSEDEMIRSKTEMEKIVKECEAHLEESFAKKEKDILI